jgi:hypothetical protein
LVVRYQCILFFCVWRPWEMRAHEGKDSSVLAINLLTMYTVLLRALSLLYNILLTASIIHVSAIR